jgi:type II secretory pathway component PulF
LIAAIFVIALVIFILGLVPKSNAPDAIKFDPLGLGLEGGTGAMIWLGACFGSIAGLVVLYLALRRFLGQGRLVDSMILRIPALGRCLRSLAMSRLCFAMNMTFSTGMSVIEAIRLSLEATDNHAFSALAGPMARDLQSGETLHEAFAAHTAFPDEFLDAIATSSESGTIPETMLRMARHYNEEAEHGLAVLNTVVAFLVWCLVALIIIFFIFRIFSSYLGLLNQAQNF